ncbi:MAG: hypothetical protein ACI9IV_000893 [Paracoccaceae bacterium]|jgi:hypothetical protein
MILKIVSLFLIGMGVLAMFGKLRLPKLPGRDLQARLKTPKKCARCGAYKIGKSPCACEQG